MNGVVRFDHSLLSIADDPESLILRAQRSRFPFAVKCHVPGRAPAVVHGVAFYFPYEARTRLLRTRARALRTRPDCPCLSMLLPRFVCSTSQQSSSAHDEWICVVQFSL